MKGEIRKEKGITLVALGVTVLILMIISGITISMLTTDHGIIDEATNAQLQTEVSKLKETTDMYVKSRQIQKLKAKDHSSTTLESELTTSNSITKVETTDGLKLGVFKDFKAVQFQTEFGEGGKSIQESWTGKITDLQDCFAIEFNTNDIYYIVDGQIWKASGIVTAEQVKEESEEAGQNKPNETPTTKPTSSTEPSTEPTTSTDPTVEPTESTEPSEEPKEKISINFLYYNKDTKSQKTETITEEIGKEAENVTITPPQIDEVKIDGGVIAQPRGWSEAEEANAQIKIENGNTLQATKADNGKTYYMSYEYTVTATYYYNNNVESGGEKEIAKAYMNYKGEKIGGIPNKPNAKQPGWTFRGWSTDYNSNAEDATEELEAITEDEMYYASYQKAYTATMHEYNNITSTVEGYKYKDYQNEESANPKVRLDSSGTSTIPEGFDTKYGWSKDDETVNATKTAEVGGIVTLEQATENNYYMIYSKVVKVTFDSNEGIDGTVTSRTGNKYTNYKNETPKAANIQMPTQEESPTRDDYELQGWGTEGTTKEYEIGQTYEFTEDKTVKAVWKSNVIDAGKITEDDVGKSVEYNTTAGINKWLPFYQEKIDGKHVLYLVAYDYAPYNETYMSKSVTGLKLVNNQYSVYWPTAPSANAIAQATEWWKKYTFSNTSNGDSKCAGSLLNATLWTSYKGAHGSETIGSPSLEMYVEAYNSRYGAGKLEYSSFPYGLSNTSGSPGQSDRAFCIKEKDRCKYWWIASPNSYSAESLMLISYDGVFSGSVHWSDTTNNGLRPIVRLNPGVKLVKDESGNLSLDYSEEVK